MLSCCIWKPEKLYYIKLRIEKAKFASIPQISTVIWKLNPASKIWRSVRSTATLLLSIGYGL